MFGLGSSRHFSSPHGGITLQAVYFYLLIVASISEGDVINPYAVETT